MGHWKALVELVMSVGYPYLEVLSINPDRDFWNTPYYLSRQTSHSSIRLQEHTILFIQTDQSFQQQTSGTHHTIYPDRPVIPATDFRNTPYYLSRQTNQSSNRLQENTILSIQTDQSVQHQASGTHHTIYPDRPSDQ